MTMGISGASSNGIQNYGNNDDNLTPSSDDSIFTRLKASVNFENFKNSISDFARYSVILLKDICDNLVLHLRSFLGLVTADEINALDERKLHNLSASIINRLTPREKFFLSADAINAFSEKAKRGLSADTINRFIYSTKFRLSADTLNAFSHDAILGLSADTLNEFSFDAIFSLSADTINAFSDETKRGLSAATINAFSWKAILGLSAATIHAFSEEAKDGLYHLTSELFSVITNGGVTVDTVSRLSLQTQYFLFTNLKDNLSAEVMNFLAEKEDEFAEFDQQNIDSEDEYDGSDPYNQGNFYDETDDMF